MNNHLHLARQHRLHYDGKSVVIRPGRTPFDRRSHIDMKTLTCRNTGPWYCPPMPPGRVEYINRALSAPFGFTHEDLIAPCPSVEDRYLAERAMRDTRIDFTNEVQGTFVKSPDDDFEDHYNGLRRRGYITDDEYHRVMARRGRGYA